ncbi:MAG: transcriptional regulator, partial [Acutalibacteraceae bacterium]|nr:transcriptional regulator [Acutalibacteraceae bacterium]
YDQWRYHYPEFDTTRKWVKMPSQELSDAMVKAFKKKLK